MQFQVITPERVVSSEEIDKVSVPTVDGEITILPHHIPLITVLKPGELSYFKNGRVFPLAVSGGFIEIRENGTIVVLADTAEHAHEIDIDRAEEARAKAVKLMSESRHRDDVSFEGVQSSLEKELARLHVGNKYRHLRSVK